MAVRNYTPAVEAEVNRLVQFGYTIAELRIIIRKCETARTVEAAKIVLVRNGYVIGV